MAAGVLLTRPDEPTRFDWIHAGVALSGESAVLSGWDALRVRGLGDRSAPHAAALLLTSSGRNRIVGGVHLRPSTRTLTVTTLAAGHPDLPHVRIASAARAISDTAAYLRRLTPVRALVTAAVQRGLATPEELTSELDDGPQGGSYFFRRALRDVAAGAASVAEAEALEFLRAGNVPPFEVNVPIVDEGGRTIAVADVLWRELRAILEIDSREFHFGEVEWKRTMRRHNQLARLGYAVAHYPPSEVRGRGLAWADEVAGWLAARAREIGRAG
jgi:hypothetical protein